jgi:uncharacterized protein YqeY
MMTTTIKEAMKDAMRAKDSTRLTVMRGLMAAFTNELVTLGRMPSDELSDEEAVAVIRRASRQRKDSIQEFESGGRPELAETEKVELAILEEYLPALMSEDAIREKALAKKDELGITDKKDMGRFMGALMQDLKGQADGDVVKKVVDSLFS